LQITGLLYIFNVNIAYYTEIRCFKNDNTFVLGEIVARNKNLLQGIIGFGRAILADPPPPPPPELKGASFVPVHTSNFVGDFSSPGGFHQMSDKQNT
jgi:hypothetical protein